MWIVGVSTKKAHTAGTGLREKKEIDNTFSTYYPIKLSTPTRQSPFFSVFLGGIGLGSPFVGMVRDRNKIYALEKPLQNSPRLEIVPAAV